MIRDISTGGAQVQMRALAPELEQRVALQFSLQTLDGAEELNLTGAVTKATKNSDDEAFPAFGVAFDSLDERSLGALRNYMFARLGFNL